MRRGAAALPWLPPVRSHCRAADLLLFFLCWRQVSADTLEHFRRHADRFRQGRVWMDGLADIDGITPHLDRETHFSDQVSGTGAHDAAQGKTAFPYLIPCALHCSSVRPAQATSGSV